MSREFDDALNDCLERIAEGEDLQKCVSRYPRHERELVPLVSVAMATMRVAAAASYGPEAKARGLSRLNQALAHGRAPRRWPLPNAWRPLARPVAIGLVAILLTGLAAGGTTVASSNSVPGEPLYWVKTLKENISLKLRRSDIGRASVHAHLASVRGKEMRKLIARGRVPEADRLMGRITHHLNKSASYAGVSLSFNPTEMPARPTRLPTTNNALKLRAMLERDSRAMRSEMSELLRNAPPGVENRVQQLIHRSELRYRTLIESLRSDAPPGQWPFWRVEPARSTER